MLYSLFAVATWFAKPLADFALLLHPFGRLALTPQEKREGAIVTGLVTAVLGALVVAYLTTGNLRFGIIAMLLASPGLAVAMSFKFDPPKPRRILQVAAAVLAVIALMLFVDTICDVDYLPAGVFRLLLQVISLSFIGILMGTNVLASQQWRR